MLENPTVLKEYLFHGEREKNYQSEAELEKEFIGLLKEQGYEYANHIRNEESLRQNLRIQLERLNKERLTNGRFSDDEWERFFKENFGNKNEGVIEKCRTIQTDEIKALRKDDGNPANIYLIDKKNLHKNSLQVINQYQENAGNHATRYDVTLLVNGLPLVHVELKRRGVSIREAFNQINRYQRDSFWAHSGWFQYVQIFIISNGTQTKYYSNTVRENHIAQKEKGASPQNTSSTQSFEFTSFWADAQNQNITDLMDFTRTFLDKNTLLNVLTKYCVLNVNNELLVMRPYQIAATEAILERIKTSSQAKKEANGDISWYVTDKERAGGYIWHATGSGKTLTSFKTAQLARSMEGVEKVLFVVDRKDLDKQTIEEFNKYEEGSVDGNVSTAILGRQLASDKKDHEIIVTTIQKLNCFISKNEGHAVFKKHCVIIFDECHRSQFGKMHENIVQSFQNYHLFGFTGTPIFDGNAAQGKGVPMTTEQIFGEKLHTYTMIDAIGDGNVLPFRVGYVNSLKQKEDRPDELVPAIDTEKALMEPGRIEKIVQYILEHFDQKTKNKRFNSLFAVQSIPMARLYYKEFKKQLTHSQHKLNIATIFSYAVNEETPEGLLQEEEFETRALDQSARDFLEKEVIRDYNQKFETSFTADKDSRDCNKTHSTKRKDVKDFEAYYKDVSYRVKRGEVDLLIVVNMFLTGFDSKKINTLWVDKPLRMHGLIQAYSRTNRILDSSKAFGNIMCFRNLEEKTNEALALFGDKDARSTILERSFNDFWSGYVDEKGSICPGYVELAKELTNNYPLSSQLPPQQEKDFVRLFGRLLRRKNILTAFDDFAEKEDILSPRDWQDYQSIYLDLYDQHQRKSKRDKADILNDIEFEIELIKQVDINIDYILQLIEKKYQEHSLEQGQQNSFSENDIASIVAELNSIPKLRSKIELVKEFIRQVNVGHIKITDWETFVKKQEEEDLKALIYSEKLKEEATYQWMSNALHDSNFKIEGPGIAALRLESSSFFGEQGGEIEQLEEKLRTHFEKYNGLNVGSHAS